MWSASTEPLLVVRGSFLWDNKVSLSTDEDF